MDKVEKLVRQLRDPVYHLRWGAAGVLGRIGEPAVPALIDALKDDDGEVRWFAAETLGNIAEKADVDIVKVRASLEEVVDREKDADGELKQWAASAYAKIAKAVAERKKKQMGGVLSSATVPKPSGKKRIYRTRRVANG